MFSLQFLAIGSLIFEKFFNVFKNIKRNLQTEKHRGKKPTKHLIMLMLIFLVVSAKKFFKVYIIGESRKYKYNIFFTHNS